MYIYRGVSRFSDNLCTMNDDNKFLKSLKSIYPKELELKAEPWLIF